MNIVNNTWGIGPFTVSNSAFPLTFSASPAKQQARTWFIHALRIHNTVLNFLGYSLILAPISGSIRIVTGFGMMIAAAVAKNRNEDRAACQLFETSMNQMVRGVFESVLGIPGLIINVALDLLAIPQDIPQKIC